VTTAAINVQRLHKHFGELEVLKGIDFHVDPGEVVCVIGPSGSGKSTLLNIIGGLDTATSGTVRFRDHELTGADESDLTRFRRDHVGFVFQFYNLIPSLTALENVELVTEISTRPMEPAKALELVGLRERVNHFPAQLSGGEQQRVAIARAVVREPDLLLADEPTGNLDERASRGVFDLFRATNAAGTIVVMATHDAELIRRNPAIRVLELEDGALVYDSGGESP